MSRIDRHIWALDAEAEVSASLRARVRTTPGVNEKMQVNPWRHSNVHAPRPEVREQTDHLQQPSGDKCRFATQTTHANHESEPMTKQCISHCYFNNYPNNYPFSCGIITPLHTIVGAPCDTCGPYCGNPFITEGSCWKLNTYGTRIVGILS